MKNEKVVLKNETGLHARPASELAKLSSKYKSEIKLKIGEKEINPKSILSIMSAGIKTNTELEIICDGEDEEIALNELVQAFNNNFGE